MLENSASLATLEPDWFDNRQRMLDPQSGLKLIKLFSGDCYVATAADEMLVTILGSCVAACIRDPIAGIGGMNHFLLPGGEDGASSKATRYGAFAMESLINGIIKAGGCKSRLEVKVFGGGNVINNSAQIGTRNAQFVRQFLLREGLRITGEDLEGDQPRRVHYLPATGKVMLRKMTAAATDGLVKREMAYRNTIAAAPAEGDIDLF